MLHPDYPTIAKDQVGWVDEAEMVEIDRIMIEDLGIELIQMMENAGRNLARVVLETVGPTSAAVAVGSGGNGGGGMVAARHLANAGVSVTVVSTRDRNELDGVPALQLAILERMAVSIGSTLPAADVAVDAVIGYSLDGPPRGRSLDLITQLRGFAGPVISLDTPSGLDASTGATPGAVVTADLTVTLALPKTGLRDSTDVGRLVLADISVPPAVSQRFGPVPNFRPSPVLLLV